MVDMVLETTQPVQFFVQKKYVSHSVYTDIQIIKKFDYSFKISNDIEKIHMFYHSMYLPMIQKRHGDHLLYTPPFVFLKYLKEAGYKLLLIMDNTDAPVSGVYFHETPKEMFIRYAGILNGDMSLMNKGASAAYYYYSILYAEDKGIEKVNVGGVRPFFGDGVFQYKRKWGLKVVKTDGAGYPEICGLYIPPCGSPLEQFLIDNPFIGVDEKNNHVGYFFFIEREQITIEQKKMLHEKYATPGIEKFQFISFDEYCGGKIEKMRSVI
ncbi:MAG: hypothetical protein NTW30_04965 [Candidatus Aenigmarchaeota archaeon]|nr:hypothetical protein [Candidatus Aenigmarchaeota archaeon]